MVKIRFTKKRRTADRDENEELEQAALTLIQMSRSNEPFTLPTDDNEAAEVPSGRVPRPAPPALPNNVIFDINEEERLEGLPRAIWPVIAACSPAFEKELTKSDVTDGQGRLTLHKEFVEKKLVPMFDARENLKEGIDVIVYDEAGGRLKMVFKLWSSKLFVLMKGWKSFYKGNDLKVGQLLSVWMFRHRFTGKLCFAITAPRRRLAEAEEQR